MVDAGKTLGIVPGPAPARPGGGAHGRVFFTTSNPLGDPDLREASEAAGALEFGSLWRSARGDTCGLDQLALRLTGKTGDRARLVALFAFVNERPLFERAGDTDFRPVASELAERIIDGRRRKDEQAEADRQTLARIARGDLSMIAPEDVNTVLFTKELRVRNLLDRHCRESGVGRAEHMRRHGLLESELDYHRRWVFHHLWVPDPPEVPRLRPTDPGLPGNSAARPRTLDRAGTDEIDDALSFEFAGDAVTVRAHICMPSLGIALGSGLDRLARERMSTIYLPQEKFPMLPREAYMAHSLAEGASRPVVTVTAEINLATGAVEVPEPRAETVRIHANHFFPEVADDRALAEDGFPEAGTVGRIVKALQCRRGAQSGHGRTRRVLSVKDPSRIRVAIAQGGIAEELVAEMMILANATLSAYARAQQIPIIYRIMGCSTLSPKRHKNVGYPCYAWFTSPLRRYADLVNMRQVMGRLGAPADAPPLDKAGLRPIARAFDAKYPQVLLAQRHLERFWVLKHLADNPDRVWDATPKKGTEIVVPGLQLGGRLIHPPRRPGKSLRVQVADVDLYDLYARFRETE